MSSNPYAPPEAPLRDPPRAPGSSVKAVLAGGALSILGGFVCARIARRDEYRP